MGERGRREERVEEPGRGVEVQRGEHGRGELRVLDQQVGQEAHGLAVLPVLHQVGQRSTLRIPSDSKRLRVRYADDPAAEWAEEWPISESEAAAAQIRACRRPALQTASFVFRRIRAQPFWEPSCAGAPIAQLCAALEARFEAIRSEAQRLVAPLLGDDDSDSDGSTSGGDWASQGEGLHTGVWQRLELWARGTRHAANLAHVPALAAVLNDSAAPMRDAPGRVYLSLMLEGTRVAPHAGPSNHRLRLHMPLLLPALQPEAQSQLGIVCAGEFRRWQAGRCLLFDDSFEHSVSLPNQTGESLPSGAGAAPCPWARVILVCDVWHPDAGWLFRVPYSS